MRIFLVLIFWLYTGSASACAVCGFSDDSRGAFLSTAIMMTFVPLIVIGSILWFVIKKVKVHELEIEQDRMAHDHSVSSSLS